MCYFRTSEPSVQFFGIHLCSDQNLNRDTNKASMPWKPDLVLHSTITPARCFIGLQAWLPSGICHQSVPSLYAKVSLFGLIRGVLPIFSQVPVLLNQEPDSCFPWQTQGPGCPELPLVDCGEEGKGAPLLPEEAFPFKMSSPKISPTYLL